MFVEESVRTPPNEAELILRQAQDDGGLNGGSLLAEQLRQKGTLTLLRDCSRFLPFQLSSASVKIAS